MSANGSSSAALEVRDLEVVYRVRGRERASWRSVSCLATRAADGWAGTAIAFTRRPRSGCAG